MQRSGKTAEPRSFGTWWTYADIARRQQGEILDQFGFGPRTMPSRTVGTWGTARLAAYQEADTRAPALLIVPAPIKTAYIWDLAPNISVVRRCRAAGLQIYLIDWQRPQPEDEEMGLAEYADRMLECLDAASKETTQPKLFLAGHSLGGTLAAIFASLHPERLQGLVTLQGPMEFNAAAGRLEAAAARMPAARAVTEILGNVSGSFLTTASNLADPMTFSSEPLLDWLECCFSPTASATYMRVRRWTLDEMPLPRRLFEEVTDQLYRGNHFADGRLDVGGRIADPRQLTMPILAVNDLRSHIVPSRSMQAYLHRTGGTDVQVLEYGGDVGVMLQHVGVLVGENAHRSLWPRILDWTRQRAHPRQ